MKRIFKIGLIGLTCLSVSSCKETRQIPGYDNTEEKGFVYEINFGSNYRTLKCFQYPR